MSKDDDICWFHPTLTREDAEALLMEGIVFNFIVENVRFVSVTDLQIIGLKGRFWLGKAAHH